MRHTDEQIQRALTYARRYQREDGAISVLADAVDDYRERWQELEHPFDQSEYDAMHERVDELEQQLRSAEGVLAQREFGYRVQMERAEGAEADRDRAVERAERARSALRELRTWALGSTTGRVSADGVDIRASAALQDTKEPAG